MSNIKHIEITCDSLAECYAQLNESELITATDLCHKAKVTIEIDLDTPFNREFVKIPNIKPTK